MKKKRGVGVAMAALCLCLAVGAASTAVCAQGQLSCADYYRPSTENYFKSGSTWGDMLIVEQTDSGVLFDFNDATATDIRTSLGYISYTLDGLHFMMENFSGEGLAFSLNSENRAAGDSANRMTFVFYNDTENSKTRISVHNGAWGADNTAFLFTREVEGTMPDHFDIRFIKGETAWEMHYNDTVIEISGEAVSAGITRETTVYVGFHAWLHGSSDHVTTYTFCLTAAHAGNLACLADLTEEQLASIRSLSDEIAAFDFENIIVNKTTFDRLAGFRSAYEALDVSIRNFVSDYTKAESAYYNLLASDSYINAMLVADSIRYMSEYEVTQNYLNELEGIRSEYALLTENEKSFITDYTLVTNWYQKLMADPLYLAAIEVGEQIAALGEDAGEEQVLSIRASYDALSAEQKTLVGNYDLLMAAEERLGIQNDADKTDIAEGCGSAVCAASCGLAAVSVIAAAFAVRNRKSKEKKR